MPACPIVDIEGNGTTPPDLVEVAALPVQDGRPDKTAAQAWLTRPNRTVTAFATRVHGFLATAWICVHNAHTDYRVLKTHLPEWEPAGVLDTLRLARAVRHDLPRHTLDALIETV